MGRVALSKAQLTNDRGRRNGRKRRNTGTRKTNFHGERQSQKAIKHQFRTHASHDPTSHELPTPPSTGIQYEVWRGNACEGDTSHTSRLVAAWQILIEFDVRGSPAEACPVIYIHRQALKSVIKELLNYQRTSRPVTASQTQHQPRQQAVSPIKMDKTPPTHTTHPELGSPPPPPSPVKLNPRNLSPDLDFDMLGSPQFDDNTANNMIGCSPTVLLKTPLSESTEEERSANEGQEGNGPNVQSRMPRGQSSQTSNENDDSESLRALQEPEFAAHFRDLCGNPVGVEERLKYLEHHAAMLISNNRKADERAQFAEKAAAERDYQLAAKENELRAMVEDHITNGVERVTIIEENLEHHKAEIQINTSNIEYIRADLKETKSRFDLFVEKAESLMQSQKVTAEKNKQHLELLSNHMKGQNQHMKKP